MTLPDLFVTVVVAVIAIGLLIAFTRLIIQILAFALLLSLPVLFIIDESHGFPVMRSLSYLFYQFVLTLYNGAVLATSGTPQL
jgi:hypothetical protein